MGRPKDFFPAFKRNTVLANLGNLRITYKEGIQKFQKESRSLSLTKFNLVLVFILSLKPHPRSGWFSLKVTQVF